MIFIGIFLFFLGIAAILFKRDFLGYITGLMISFYGFVLSFVHAQKIMGTSILNGYNLLFIMIISFLVMLGILMTLILLREEKGDHIV